jgi:hydroxymethylpyrimidine pyrophosphatase-like HAD family hydrolase
MENNIMIFFTESGIKTEAEAEFDEEYEQSLDDETPEQNKDQLLSDGTLDTEPAPEPDEDESDEPELDAEPDEDEELFESDDDIMEESEETVAELVDRLIELTKSNTSLNAAFQEIKEKYNLDENQEIEEDVADTVAEEDVLPESIIANSIETLKRMY